MNNRRTFLTFLAVATGGALWAGVSGAKQPPQQLPPAPAAPPPLWADEERKAVVAYWNAPGRYVIEEKPADVPPHVNITVSGSEWYWKYVRALPDVRKANPAQAEQWEKNLNGLLVLEKRGNDFRLAQLLKPTQFDGYPNIGELPAEMQAAIGPTPDFYETVHPKRYNHNLCAGRRPHNPVCLHR